MVWRKSPGLTQLCSSTQSGFRGGLLVGSLLYTAWSGKAATYTSSGTETLLTGTLNGSEKVFWARNMKSPTPDVVCVAPGTGAFSVTPSAVTSFADPDIGLRTALGLWTDISSLPMAMELFRRPG